MIKINGRVLEKNYFPDKTLRLNIRAFEKDIRIDWNFENNEELVILQLIVPHLREKYDISTMKLFMPYIPNARMDRTHKLAEVFTLKYFCNIINSLQFDEILVRDAHSNVSLALLNNVHSYDIMQDIYNVVDETCPDIVFYPDEGACKRYSEIIKNPYLFGIKKREWDTGKILGLDVIGNVPNKPFNVLIIDDISSYGGTFYHSAKKLKELGAEKIYLYITHCENSILEGELINSGLVEKIFTTESIFTKEHPLIEII